MAYAELVDSGSFETTDPNGHTVRISHVASSVGIATVRSVLVEEPRADFFIVGGYGSGGSYEILAGSLAEIGYNAHTIRHGNDVETDTFEADAIEVAAAIETLSGDRPIYEIGHSKGGPVSLLAAAMLSKDFNLVRIDLVDPAIGIVRPPQGLEVLGAAAEIGYIGVFYGRQLKHASKGKAYEDKHRPHALKGEYRELTTARDYTPQVDVIGGEREVDIRISCGSFDHIVPAELTKRAAARLGLPCTDRPGYDLATQSHFGIIVKEDFVQTLNIQ